MIFLYHLTQYLPGGTQESHSEIKLKPRNVHSKKLSYRMSEISLYLHGWIDLIVFSFYVKRFLPGSKGQLF